jgi:hypothetical protein
MPCLGYHPSAGQPGDPLHDPEQPNWWLSALVAALLYLVLAATLARADPVPARYDAPRHPGSTRGLDELRDPPGHAASYSTLLRSCVPCHAGSVGPRLFRGGNLLGCVERHELKWSLDQTLRQGSHGGWIRTIEWTPREIDRPALEAALALVDGVRR